MICARGWPLYLLGDFTLWVRESAAETVEVARDAVSAFNYRSFRDLPRIGPGSADF